MRPMPAFALSAAVLAFSTPALSQTSVTLYGLIDNGINYLNNAHGKTLWSMQDGALTGIYGSRWGLLGEEALGGGLSAIFRIESGFSITNGKAGQGGLAFGRQAYVGLKRADLGTVTFGRQYDSIVDYVQPATFNSRWGGLMVHASDIDNTANTFRVNNSVKYGSPVFNGLQFGGLYALSNSNADGGPGTTAAWSVGASYTYSTLRVAAAYFYAKHPATEFVDGHNVANTTGSAIGAAGPWSYVGTPRNQSIAGAGATYILGSLTFGAAFTWVNFDDANGTSSSVRFRNYDVWVNYAVTPATSVGLGYLYTDGKVGYSGEEPKYHRIGIGTDYKFSKRTSVYAVASVQQAAGDAKGASLYQGVAGDASSTNRQFGARLGMIHRF